MLRGSRAHPPSICPLLLPLSIFLSAPTPTFPMHFHFMLLFSLLPPQHISPIELLFSRLNTSPPTLPSSLRLNRLSFPQRSSFPIVSLTALMVLSLFYCRLYIPLIPLFHPISLLLTFTLSIHLSSHRLLFMNLIQRERKGIKMHLQHQEDLLLE